MLHAKRKTGESGILFHLTEQVLHYPHTFHYLYYGVIVTEQLVHTSPSPDFLCATLKNWDWPWDEAIHVHVPCTCTYTVCTCIIHDNVHVPFPDCGRESDQWGKDQDRSWHDSPLHLPGMIWTSSLALLPCICVHIHCTLYILYRVPPGPIHVHVQMHVHCTCTYYMYIINYIINIIAHTILLCHYCTSLIFTCALISVSHCQVNWRQSRIPFSHRFDKYLDPNFFQHRVIKLISCVLLGMLD